MGIDSRGTRSGTRGGGHDNISEEGGSFDENMTSVGPVNDVQRAGIKMNDCEERIRP